MAKIQKLTGSYTITGLGQALNEIEVNVVWSDEK